MSFTVACHPDVAKRDLPKIPADQRERIQRAIEERLTLDPTKYADRLRKDLAGAWKLRVGDYRVVFDLDGAKRVIVILMIAHRSVVYDRVLRRRR